MTATLPGRTPATKGLERLFVDVDAARAAGRDVARQGAVSLGVEEPSVEALARAGIGRLSRLGIRAEVMRARPNCVVVRSTKTRSEQSGQGCALLSAWLEELPLIVHDVAGTVVESSCGTRGAGSCLHTLLWQAPDGADGGSASSGSPSQVAEVLSAGAGSRPGTADGACEPSSGSSGGGRHDGTEVGDDGPQSWVDKATSAFRSSAGAGVAPPAPSAPPAPPAPSAPSAPPAPTAAPSHPAAPGAATPAASGPTPDGLSRREPAARSASPTPAAAQVAPQVASAPSAQVAPRRPPAGDDHPVQTSARHLEPAEGPSVAGSPAGASKTTGAGAVTHAPATVMRPALTPVPAARVWVSAPAPSSKRRAPSGRRWAWVRRRAWLLALGLVAGAAGGYYASSHHATSYSATAVLVVRSGASTTGPGNANDAEALAVTDAAAMPKDQTVVDAVAQQLHVPVSEVSSHMSVEAQAGTSLLQVHYSASTAAEAIRGVNALATVVSGTRANDQAIANGSVAVVSRADSAAGSSTLTKEGLPLGAVLGLLLGAGAALAAERADRRVDEIETLRDATGVPVSTEPGGMSPVELSRALARSAGDGSCALVPLRAGQAEIAEQLARDLIRSGRAGAGEVPAPAIGVTPPFADAPDAVCIGEGPTVLVVGAGERARVVGEVVERLRQVGRSPVWSVLVASR